MVLRKLPLRVILLSSSVVHLMVAVSVMACSRDQVFMLEITYRSQVDALISSQRRHVLSPLPVVDGVREQLASVVISIKGGLTLQAKLSTVVMCALGGRNKALSGELPKATLSGGPHAAAVSVQSGAPTRCLATRSPRIRLLSGCACVVPSLPPRDPCALAHLWRGWRGQGAARFLTGQRQHCTHPSHATPTLAVCEWNKRRTMSSRSRGDSVKTSNNRITPPTHATALSNLSPFSTLTCQVEATNAWRKDLKSLYSRASERFADVCWSTSTEDENGSLTDDEGVAPSWVGSSRSRDSVIWAHKGEC